MKTIPEILDLAIASIDNLPTAMLHCKVLADGLGHQGFQEWVTDQVNGYNDFRKVPHYRKIRGKLGGMFERYLIDVTYDHVPPQVLGPQLHSLLETISLWQPVGVIATFRDDGSVSFPVMLESDVLGLINSHFGTRGWFVSIWVTCPAGSIRPVLVAIQHRLVSFLSEVNQLLPDAQDYATPTPEKVAAIDRSFDTHLSVGHANNVIIAPGYVHVDQSSNVFQQINVGNWADLNQFLSRQNIPPDKREAVKEILDKIEQGDEPEEGEQQLKEWVEEAAADMASGVGEVLKEATKKAATETLVDGLKRYAPEIAKWAWVAVSSLT